MTPEHTRYARDARSRSPLGRRAAAVLLVAAVALVAAGCEDPSLKFNQAGLQAYRQGDYTRARAGFEEAIHHNPDIGIYYFNRAMCEQAIGNLAEAVFNYEMGTKLDPKLVQAYKNAATCHIQMGKPEKALAALEDGTRANPYTGEAFINLGKFHESRGDMFNAKLSMAKAVAADPENPASHREYAQILIRTGDREKGIEHLRKSLELQPIQPHVSAQVTELAPPGNQLPPPKQQTE